jgi:hypothetical protein
VAVGDERRQAGMIPKLFRIAAVLAAGGALLQAQGCADTAVDTLWRIGFSTFFLPVNQFVLTFFTAFGV